MSMKVNVGWVVFFTVLGGFLVWIFNQYIKLPSKTVTIMPRKEYDIVTFKLPNSGNTQIFGSKYWEAFHTLAEMIPCSICRKDAVPMMSYMHDLVNYKINHTPNFNEIFDKKNFEKWIDKSCEIKEKLKETNI